MRTLKEAIELIRIAAGKDGFRHYNGSGGIWAGNNTGIADARFDDWGLANSTVVILNAVLNGELVPVTKEALNSRE